MKGLHVDDGGVGGVPVVLQHGLGADQEVWREQIGHLRRSRRVLAFDMRGHGRSPRASEYSVAALVTDLEEVTAGLPRFWLVGHSLAGVVLTEFAGRRQERLHGPGYVDAEGNDDNPRMASRLPGVKQRKISGVSHWLMLDDPPAFDAALDEALQ